MDGASKLNDSTICKLSIMIFDKSNLMNSTLLLIVNQLKWFDNFN